MTTLNLRPSQLDIDGTVGDDISIVATVVDASAVAVDVSGYTITADVIRNAASIASFGVAVGGAGQNEITLTLTDTQTAAIDNIEGLTWRLKVINGASTQNWIAGDFELAAIGTPKTGTGVASSIVTVSSVTITLAESGGGGSGDLLSTNNLNDVASASAARTNLGLGALAVLDTVTVYHDIYWTFPSTASQGDAMKEVPAPRDGTIHEVEWSAGIAPTTASIIGDITIDGTSTWNTTPANRPTIATSSKTATGGALDTAAFSAGDMLQPVLDQLDAGDEGSVGQILVRLTWYETAA